MLIVCCLQWRWRNLEVFERCRLQLEQRMKMIGEVFEKDEVLLRAGEFSQAGWPFKHVLENSKL